MGESSTLLSLMYRKALSINLPSLVDFVDAVIDTNAQNSKRYVSASHAATGGETKTEKPVCVNLY